MIDFQLDQASLAAEVDHIEATRQNILAAIRHGMTEGTEGLAEAVAAHLEGSPIQTRTGDLLNAVLKSPRVTETEGYIKGEVSTSNGSMRNKGLWLEFGVSEPAVGPVLYHFTAPDGKSVFTNGHAAFRVAPKPFFNPTFQQYYPTLLDRINALVAEAFDAAV